MGNNPRRRSEIVCREPAAIPCFIDDVVHEGSRAVFVKLGVGSAGGDIEHGHVGCGSAQPHERVVGDYRSVASALDASAIGTTGEYVAINKLLPTGDYHVCPAARAAWG